MTITRIYGLVDPRDGKVRYVGRTAQPLNKRLRGHFYKRRVSSHTRRDHWIALLLSMDIKPDIRCLAVVNDNGFEAERWWISKLKSLGMDLVNAHEGGGGCIPGVKPPKRSVSPEVRARISAKLKGRKIGFALKPFVWTPEKQQRAIEASRAVTLGSHHSEEMKTRIRQSNIKTWSDPKLRAANSERTKIQLATPESKEKYREVQKKAWASLTPDGKKHRLRGVVSRETHEKSIASRHRMTIEEYTARIEGGEKWCATCKVWKPIESFSETHYGRYIRCRSCVRVINLKYRKVS